MNLFRKQKFSIRKFNIGIFSALIATVTFLAHPGQASAAELDSTQSNNPEGATLDETAQPSQDPNVNPQANNEIDQSNVNQATDNQLPNNAQDNAQAQSNDTEQTQSQSQNANNEINQSNKENNASNANTLPTNENSENDIHVDKSTQHHIEAKSETKSKKDVKNTSQPITPDAKAVIEESDIPKKRSRRAVEGNNASDVNTVTNNTDPNSSNTGPNSLNTVLTFDDLGIKTSTNRVRPEVKVLNSLSGFTMVNGGQVGLLNSVLERTGVFDTGEAKNYQAVDNVVALGRIHGNDPNDHGGFNGIEKEFTVNPNSEVIFEFNTMTARNYKGGTNLVVRNAENNQEIATADIQGGGVWRLFKIPENVNRIKVQFLPNNDIQTNYQRILQLQDGYRYYSFIDTIGVYSGSHLYVKSRQVNKNVKNSKEFEINTRIENNGNFAASLNRNELTYTVTLPENFEYVENSTEASFLNGNVPNTTITPLSVNFDRQNRTLTFTSNGLTSKGSNTREARFLPNKILNIRYKLRPVNIETPREVTFNESLKYKTYAEIYVNTNDNTVIAQQSPFSLNVIMNKDNLEEQVNKEIIPSNYTWASYTKYNKLKETAQTVLDEENQNVPFDQRYSQSRIDNLLHELQTTLINRVNATHEINHKAQEMSDSAENNTELTSEEREALLEQIGNHKSEISNDIDDQTTDQGVEQVKNEGLTTLEGDVGQPVVKPNARNEINNKVTEQKNLINQNNEATQEEKNEAVTQVDTHSADALRKISEADSNDQVNNAKDEGLRLINSDVPQPQQKAQARAVINQKVQEKINEINGNAQATRDEKDAAIGNVNQAKDQALQNINNADTNGNVTSAKNTGVNAIEQLTVTPVKKQSAIDEIKAKAQQQKQAIQQNNEATNEEKATAENSVDQAVTTATANINRANTNAEVDQAQSNGDNAIVAINPATKVKQDARQTIEAKAQAQQEQINSNNKATTEEKEEALNKVNTHKQNALSNINNAHSNQEVQTAQQNGVNAINQDQPEALKKPQATSELNQNAQTKKQDINQTPDATDEEKLAANNQVDQALTDGIQQINNANGNNDVDNAKNNATQVINNVTVDVQKKPQAKQALSAKATEKLNAINADNEGTNEEKATAIQNVTDAKNNADNQISQATSNHDVDVAKNGGITNISSIRPVYTKKQQARAQINDKFNAKEAEINNTPNATQEEKNEAITRLTQSKDNALQQINQAQSNDNVDAAQTGGIQALDNVNANVVKKQQAKESIRNTAEQRKQAIQNNDDATNEEKEVANQLVDAAINKVNTNIDNANTNDQVDNAVNVGTQNINAITPATTVKTNAKNEIDSQSDNKKVKNEKATDATDEEIQEANRKVDEAQAEAKTNIQIASANDLVNEAKSNGINKINAITPATTVKTDARKAIQDKAFEQIELIKATPDATNEEKQAAIAKVNSELAKAQEQINSEHTTQRVNDAKTNAVSTIGQITAQPIEKQAARDAINQKANEQTTSINANNNATDEEKAEANTRVNDAKQTALNAIDNATTSHDVSTAKSNGTTSIGNVVPSTNTKTNAKNDIDTALNKQIETINAHNTATTEEKEAAVQIANQKATEAKTNIQNAHNNEGVNQAKTNGIDQLNNVEPNAIQKDEAKQAIQDKKNAQNNIIDATTNATDEEKEAAKVKVTEAGQLGDSKVDQAQTNQQVTNAKTETVDNINNIRPIVVKKPTANNEIDAKFEEVKQAINATPNATTDEKNEAIQRLTAKKEEIKNQISQDTKNNQVEQHKVNGLQELGNIHVNPVKKSEAIQAVEEKVNSQNGLITNNNDATDEEKASAKQLVEAAKNKAVTNINESQTNAQVDNAKDSGMNEISAIQPATTIKSDAKTAIDQKAQQQSTIIDGNNDATDEEKTEAKNLVEAAKTEAKGNITSQHTTSEVNDAKVAGMEKINTIQPATTVKTNAKQDLQRKANEQKEQINQTPDATEEEKQEAISRVNTALAEATQKINQAHSTNDVNLAKDEGINTINGIHPTVAKKQNAINELTQKASEQKTLISHNNDSTDDEKNDAKQLVDAKLAEEIQNINNSTRDAQVDAVKDRAINEINAINAQAHKRQDAINALTAQAESKKADIRNNKDATTEEKNTAIQSIDAALTQARNNINGAQTNATVDEKLEEAKQSLQQIEVTPQTKPNAKAEITNAVNKQREAINSNQNATTEEKEAALHQLNQEASIANNNIQEALADQNVADAKNNSLTAIANVQPILVKKPAANDVINKKVSEQTELINNNQDATTEEKQAALTKLDTVKNTALENINQAHSNEDVQNAENAGVAEISKIVPETTVKQNAKQEIEQSAQNQVDIINGNPNATIEEKTEAINKVNTAKAEAIKNITNATTTQLVQDARDNGNNTITQIEPETAVKTNAIQAIATAAKDKNNLIDQTANATAEEMEEANNKVDRLQEEADANVTKANTTDEVNNIKAQALQNINAVQPEVVKKQNAKNELNQYVEKQKQVIESTPEATKEEKDEAKKLLNNESASATGAINNAYHNSEVETALNDAKPKIEAIVPKVRKKRSALDELQASADNQIQNINQNTEATVEERNEALAKVNTALEEAKANINNAQTNDEVDNLKATNTQKIEQIQPVTEVRANARKALNEKAQEQNVAIDNNPNATIEEKIAAKELVKQELETAKYRVNHANTNQDVQDVVTSDSNTIAQIQPATKIKDDAKADVNAENAKKQQEIANNNEATTEEKDVAQQQLNQVTNNANQAILDAPDTNQVNVEKNKGVNSIRDINPQIVKKPTAKAEFDKVAKTKKEEINQIPNATTDETHQSLNQLNQVVQEAKNQVDQAQTNAQVDQAQQDGVNKITNLRPVVAKKQSAIDEINQAKQNRIDEINQAFSATDEEKETAKQFINDEAQKALSQINSANTNADVDTAKNSGLNTINQYTPDFSKKKNATLKLYDVVDAQEAIINAFPDATEDEKQDAINKVEALLLDAKKQIAHAENNKQVDDIYNEASNQIKAILPDVITKSNARDVLKSLANQLIRTFEHTPDVTDEERNDAISHVKEQLNAVLGAIDKDTRDVQVAQEKIFGLNDLNSIVINVIQKPTARKAVNKKAEEINASINNTPNATDEEKQVALDKVTSIVNDANDRIRNAKADSEVLTAKTEAITLLSAVSPVVEAKPSALSEIQQQATNQKAQINQNSEATKEEKEAAIQLVDQYVKQGEDRLDVATKNQQVQEIKDDIKEKISNVTPLVKVKPEALKQILAKLDNQRDLINNNAEATDEEKAAAIDKIVEASTKFATTIDNATTNESVENAKNQSIEEIAMILPEVSKKPQAKLELKQKADEIRATINSNNDATTEEKNAAINTLDELLAKANEAIQNAQTNAEVDKAKELALPDIQAVKVLAVVKPQAKNQIQAIFDRKQSKFETNKEATKEEKQKALDELLSAIKSINNSIQNAHTNAEVTESLNDGIAKLDAIEITARKKALANTYLQGLSDEKIHEIESDNDATIEEKQVFTSKVKALLNRIQLQIAEAETNEDVDNSVKNFKIELNKLDLKAHKKLAAKQRIQQKANEIIQIIEANNNASAQAKLAAKALVSKILDDAYEEINEANHDATVDEIVKKAIEKLNAVKVKEDLNVSNEPSKDTSNCDSETNTTQETVDQLPDTGDSNDSAPLAGAALISGLALLAARKSKKDKNA